MPSAPRSGSQAPGSSGRRMTSCLLCPLTLTSPTRGEGDEEKLFFGRCSGRIHSCRVEILFDAGGRVIAQLFGPLEIGVGLFFVPERLLDQPAMVQHHGVDVIELFAQEIELGRR